METQNLVAKLEKAVPGAVLQKSRFGRAGGHCVWIEARAIPSVAAALCADQDLGLDWLENLSVAQLDDALVVTYFVRSRRTSAGAVLRASVAPKSDDAVVVLPSVTKIWPMAEAWEHEAAELFGIRFEGLGQKPALLPKGWLGFPLRKTYVFPREFFDIQHSRGSPKAPVTEDSHNA